MFLGVFPLIIRSGKNRFLFSICVIVFILCHVVNGSYIPLQWRKDVFLSRRWLSNQKLNRQREIVYGCYEKLEYITRILPNMTRGTQQTNADDVVMTSLFHVFTMHRILSLMTFIYTKDRNFSVYWWEVVSHTMGAKKIALFIWAGCETKQMNYCYDNLNTCGT